MALIRAVKRNSGSGMWGYIEWSDEDPNNTIHMVGSKEFAEEQDCIDYSKGFAPDSYEWVEPKELKQQRLLKKIENLSEKLSKAKDELIDTGYIFPSYWEEVKKHTPDFFKESMFRAANSNELFNHPDPITSFDWNAYMAMLEYEKICRKKYDREPPMPSLPPRQPHRMIDFATTYHTTMERMKRHDRQVESDLTRDEYQLVVIYKFNEEESRIEIYNKVAKLVRIHQVKRKGGKEKQILDFNKELLRVFTEFPNNTIVTDPRSEDWRINNCLNPNFTKWKRI